MAEGWWTAWVRWEGCRIGGFAGLELDSELASRNGEETKEGFR
jgi:hypothetical protein